MLRVAKGKGRPLIIRCLQICKSCLGIIYSLLNSIEQLEHLLLSTTTYGRRLNQRGKQQSLRDNKYYNILLCVHVPLDSGLSEGS